ncbi:hypothetical protein FRC10_003621 [Ceratobasidium sp. 414]|nr:hypothetical protein FRC10_003621 [Ceratobasidium sp. 414]
MENWPTDSRAPEAILPAPKRQGPHKVRPEPHWNTPLLDGGTLDSSRLVTGKRGDANNLRWDGISTAVERLTTGNTRCIFPPTRVDFKQDHGLPFEQKVLRTNTWLRNYKNMIDMEATFLHEMLKDDEKYRQNVLGYDPYVSDLLSMSFISKGHKKRAGILAYPMGEHFRSLGASVLFDEKWGTVVVPTEKPVWIANSPIFQITSSNSIYKPSAVDYTNAGCLFVVRTLFDVNFLSIRPKPGAVDPTKAQLLASFNSTDIGGHRPLDVALSPDQTSEILVVSDVGAIWSAGLESPPRMLFSSTEDSSFRVGAYDSPYWGVAWGSHPQTLLLGSQSYLNLYDSRSPSVASAFAVHSGTLTSFDVLRNEDRSQIFLSDTERVTLLDERMLTRPLVSWRHHRENDRTLSVKALTIEDKQVGLLSSRRSHFVSVYDPVLNENGSLSKCDSYGLDFRLVSRSPPASIATYVPSSRSKSAALGTLFRLTDTGAIYRQDLAIGPCGPSGEDEIWAHELQRLASRISMEDGEYENVDLMENTEISLRKEYASIYANESLDRYLAGPSVVDIVDLAPSAFQRANEPIDRIMTQHDMIRIVSQEASGANPRTLFASSRSLPLPSAATLLKFVTQLRARTYEAAPWSFDLSEVQRRLSPSSTPTPSPKELSAFNTNQASVGDEENTLNRAGAKDERAREEIALDLALATTIYSSLPFQPSRPRLPPAPIARGDDEMLSVAASALTLEEAEPPHLNHVQPCPTEGLIDGKMGAEQRQSLIVRLLASEWDPDSSVDDYEFFDPYGQDYDVSMPAWKLSARTKADREALQQAKSMLSTTRVGLGVRSVNKPLLPSMQIPRPKPAALKQDARRARQGPSRLGESQPEPSVIQTMSSQPREPEYSQTSQMVGSSQIPSTQVLAGPFGGRPGAATTRRKKPRLAGF